jgi:hypothetical protein
LKVEDPIPILEQMLTREPGPENTHLKVSREFYDDDFSPEEVEAIVSEFARDFQAIAARIETAWGPPEFIGQSSESAFPEFYVAEGLAYWQRDDALALVWWEHQDQELPVLLTLAVLTQENMTDG